MTLPRTELRFPHLKKDSHTEVFVEVMLWQDDQQLWRAWSPAPYIDPSDYGYRKWGDVAKAVIDDILADAGHLSRDGIAIRVRFVPAIVTKDHGIVRAFRARSA